MNLIGELVAEIGEVMNTNRDGGAFLLGVKFCDNEKQILDDISHYVRNILNIFPE